MINYDKPIIQMRTYNGDAGCIIVANHADGTTSREVMSQPPPPPKETRP